MIKKPVKILNSLIEKAIRDRVISPRKVCVGKYLRGLTAEEKRYLKGLQSAHIKDSMIRMG